MQPGYLKTQTRKRGLCAGKKNGFEGFKFRCQYTVQKTVQKEEAVYVEKYLKQLKS